TAKPLRTRPDGNTNFRIATLQCFDEIGTAWEEDSIPLEEGIPLDRGTAIPVGLGTNVVIAREVQVDTSIPDVADGFKTGCELSETRNIRVAVVAVIVESGTDESVPIRQILT